MMRWWQERKRRRKARAAHRDPVPAGTPRPVILDDNPWPTYIGTRAWCSGTPLWSDGTCRCTHTEEAPHRG